MGFQVAFESLNVFAQSMSAGREFQVDGAATEKARRASSVCMRGMTSSGASEELKKLTAYKAKVRGHYVKISIQHSPALQRKDWTGMILKRELERERSATK